ncbi:MAG: zinc finger CDGSH-type domain protein [Bacillales bacterium]|jgi:CDGSH-type Zn-finger protein|nr:zinc finger CDGSH-type domain protein [Bacillales bacterium]
MKLGGNVFMSNMKIQAMDNGPLVVSGQAELLDGEGILMETNEECYLCRCGLSNNTPYCTGAHEGKFHNLTRRKV